MKKTIIAFVCLALTAVVCCRLSAETDNGPSQAGSYEFNDLSVAEALRTIGRDTGIVINAPYDMLRETVHKSYRNISVEEIIRDLLKRENHAVVWHYIDRRIVAVDIRIGEAGTGNVRSDSGGRAETTDNIVRTGLPTRSEPARRYNPSAARRSPPPPPPDRQRYHQIETPPMPPVYSNASGE